MPGRKFSTTTSADRINSVRNAWPSTDFKSMATLFLLRLTLRKYVLQPPTNGARSARIVAVPRILDLDHLSAHVAEQHRAQRPGQHACEVEDAQPGQRQLRTSRFGHVESDRGQTFRDAGCLEVVLLEAVPAHAHG